MLGFFSNHKRSKDKVSAILIQHGLVLETLTITKDVCTIIAKMETATLNDIALAQTALENLKLWGKVKLIPTRERMAAPAPKPRKTSTVLDLPVKHIIAVGSGKGGVGKSTVAANLAVALARLGHKVGLLDIDIYGPSVPTLFGLQGQKLTQIGNRIHPISAQGIKLMSLGFLVDTESPMIWRGPMVQSAVRQMLVDVDWSDCDILILDLPPGTGDAQLTLAQQVKLSGAVIVSTPQDLALIDARKAIEMFRKTHIPILGVVENMSHYICPNCGHADDVFGHGGAKDESTRLGVPFLGEIPLNTAIRLASDTGDFSQNMHYTAIANAVWQGLQTAQKPAPKIIFE